MASEVRREKPKAIPTEPVNNTRREIEVEVPAAEVARETDTLIQKYQKLARLPGFRRGHIPASVIRQRFSEEVNSEVGDVLLRRDFRQESDRLSLMPVSQPRLSELHIHAREPLPLKASLEVLRVVKVDRYKEVPADKANVYV